MRDFNSSLIRIIDKAAALTAAEALAALFKRKLEVDVCTAFFLLYKSKMRLIFYNINN